MEKVLEVIRDYFLNKVMETERGSYLLDSDFTEEEYKIYKKGLEAAYMDAADHFNECIKSFKSKKKKFYEEKQKELQEAFEETFSDMFLHLS